MQRLMNDVWSFAKLPCGALPGERTRWESVDLPHDFLIAQADDLYESCDGWYRRALHVPQDGLRQVWLLRFDAEAKLLESGVFMPIYGDGGAYAMNRAVPRSETTTSWGLDEYRWYTAMVANELITTVDRDAITGIWGEAADADEFFTNAKAYLLDHGYTLTDTWNQFSSYDMETWDVIATSYTSDSYFIAGT